MIINNVTIQLEDPSNYSFINDANISVININTKVMELASFETSLSLCVEGMKKYIFLNKINEYHIYFFVRSEEVFFQNALQKRKGIWGKYGIDWLPPPPELSHIVSVERDETVCSNCFKIPFEKVFNACDFIRKTQNRAFLVFTKDDLFEKKLDLKRTIEVISDSHWQFDKHDILKYFFSLSRNCIVGLCYGSFDDVTVDIDLFIDTNDTVLKLMKKHSFKTMSEEEDPPLLL